MTANRFRARKARALLLLYPRCEPLHIFDGELRILLFPSDIDPDRYETDRCFLEEVTKVEEIILGPVTWDRDRIPSRFWIDTTGSIFFSPLFTL